MDVLEYLDGGFAPGKNGMGFIHIKDYFKDEDQTFNHRLFPHTVNARYMASFFEYVYDSLHKGRSAGIRSDCLHAKFQDLAWMITELTPAHVGTNIMKEVEGLTDSDSGYYSWLQ